MGVFEKFFRKNLENNFFCSNFGGDKGGQCINSYVMIEFVGFILMLVLGGYLLVTSENVEVMIHSRKFKRIGIGIDYEMSSNSMYDSHRVELSLVVLFVSLTFTRYQT